MSDKAVGNTVYNHNFGFALSPEQTIKAGAIRRVAAELYDTIVIECNNESRECIGDRAAALASLWDTVRAAIGAVSRS